MRHEHRQLGCLSEASSVIFSINWIGVEGDIQESQFVLYREHNILAGKQHLQTEGRCH